MNHFLVLDLQIVLRWLKLIEICANSVKLSECVDRRQSSSGTWRTVSSVQDL